MQQLRLRQLPLARHASDSLPRAITRYQDADLLAGNTTLAGMTTTPARRALQMPCSLFRLQQIHLIGFGDAMQTVWVIGFCQCQEAMAPAKAGIAVYAELLRGLAYRIRVQQAIGIIQPQGFMAQMRQRRTRQRIEGLATRYAAIALQIVGVTVPVQMLRATFRAA